MLLAFATFWLTWRRKIIRTRPKIRFPSFILYIPLSLFFTKRCHLILNCHYFCCYEHLHEIGTTKDRENLLLWKIAKLCAKPSPYGILLVQKWKVMIFVFGVDFELMQTTCVAICNILNIFKVQKFASNKRPSAYMII